MSPAPAGFKRGLQRLILNPPRTLGARLAVGAACSLGGIGGRMRLAAVNREAPCEVGGVSDSRGQVGF